MFEYELNDYFEYKQLYKDLISKETTKSKKVTTINSNEREGLISQMMMDKFDLELNKDKRFKNGRKIYFYEIKCLNKERQIIKEIKIVKINNNQQYSFEVDGIKYSMELREKNPALRKVNDEGNNISIKSDKSGKSGIKSIDQFSVESTNKSEDQKMEKNEKFILKKIKDITDTKTYIFQIYYTSHEIDGNLTAKHDIDLKDGLQDIMFYPNLESVKKEEEQKKIEESDKIEEIPAKTEGLTKIFKDSKILIELKQNTTLEKLFEQMENLLKDLSILFPGEQYYYLGFVNDIKAQKDLNKEDFVKRIQECERLYPKFKIFLFTIKDNTLFDLELADKANYSVYFRNEIKREIKELKGTLTKEIGNMKKEIGSINMKMEGMKAEINNIKTEMGDMKTEIGNLRTDVNSLKNDNNILRKEINDQFQTLKNMIMELKDDKKDTK